MWTQEEMIEAASGYEEALCSPDETRSSFKAETGIWKYVESLEITELAQKYFTTPDDAKSWLFEQIKEHEDDGYTDRANDFYSMLDDGVEMPIIVGDSADGMEVWDGMHRLAASYAREEPIPAFVGKQPSEQNL